MVTLENSTMAETTPLNILLISRCPPYPVHLGDRLIPYHVMQELSARGHKIDLIALYNQPNDPAQVSHYQAMFRSVQLIPETPRTAMMFLRRLFTPSQHHPTRRDQAWSPQLWDAISNQLAKQSYDVVHLFGGVQVYECLSLVKNLPNVIVPYESFSLYLTRLLAQQKSLPQKLNVWLQSRMAQAYERMMFRGFGAVVVLAEPDRLMLNKLSPNLPLHIIPNGVDVNYFTSSGAQPEPATVIFVGNMEYEPNADGAMWLATGIFPQVRRQIPTTKLLLVGNNPSESLRNIAAGSGGAIEVTGRVPDVRPYLERATIFVSPLRMGAGIKNKVLEAMAMARPLIMTPLSADGIDLVDGVHAAFADTADVIARRIVELINAPERREQMAVENRKFIEQRFIWKQVGDSYERLYRSLREN
jgi:polysaccharide biosynthesis protein PslH